MRWNRRLLAALIGYGRGAVVAFQFLSRIPLPIQVPFNADSCRRSTWFFPLVGCAIGWVLYGMAMAVTAIFPPLVSAVLLTGWWMVLTGALHLDGWIDTADGIFSHRSRERMLKIMKDSRIGAMGAVAAMLALMLKAALLYSIIEHGLSDFAFFLVLTPVLSRWFMTVAIAGWPYAHRDGGFGLLFGGVRWLDVWGSAAVALACSWITGAIGIGPDEPRAILSILVLIGAAIAGGWGLAAYLSHRLGGLTGDVYGAINEGLELLLLMVAWVVVTT